MPISMTFALRACAASDDARQVLPREIERQAAQAVVGAEFDDHDLGSLLGQHRFDARRTAGGGLAADAGIGHAPARLLQLGVEQMHPTLLRRQVEGGRERIAEHQHAPRRGGVDQARTQQRDHDESLNCNLQDWPHADRSRVCARFRSVWMNAVREDAITEVNAAPVLIDVHGLTRRVALPGRELTILDDVSFRVRAGESVAIVGASGSGKSTLLALLAGLDVASSGDVRIAGTGLATLDEDARARLRSERVGFVFQNFQLLPALTALENVMLPLELAGIDDAETPAQQILGRVGLGERLDHYPRQLSGGEQQRVAIARAFVTRPQILFADEPTGNLDTATGRVIADLLFELNHAAGTTLILVTHDERLAARCARQLRLDGGRLVSRA